MYETDRGARSGPARPPRRCRGRARQVPPRIRREGCTTRSSSGSRATTACDAEVVARQHPQQRGQHRVGENLGTKFDRRHDNRSGKREHYELDRDRSGGLGDRLRRGIVGVNRGRPMSASDEAPAQCHKSTSALVVLAAGSAERNAGEYSDQANAMMILVSARCGAIDPGGVFEEPTRDQNQRRPIRYSHSCAMNPRLSLL